MAVFRSFSVVLRTKNGQENALLRSLPFKINEIL